jgi:VWFA-related protein
MLVPRVALIIVLTIPATGYSQISAKVAKDQKAPQTLSANSELVQVRAVVTDRAGKLIDGLIKGDFLLTEDGVPQSPDFFSVEQTEGKSGAPSGMPREAAGGIPGGAPGHAAPNSSRVVVLLVDTAHITSNGLEGVRLALKQFISEQMAGKDLAAIMTSAGKPGAKGEFTNDRRKLEADLKEIRPGYTQFESFLSPALCGKVVQGNLQAISLAVTIIDSEDRTTGGMLIPGPGNPQAEAVSKCRMQLLQTASRRRTVTTAIGTAIDKMSTLPGQHIVALFTEGFSMIAPGGEVAIPDIRPVVSSAGRAGVMIYAFEAKVPMASKQVNIDSYSLASEIRESTLDFQHGMSLLASETGGEAFYNLDSLSNQMQEMLDDNRVCYRLAYYPPPGKDPKKYRSINVSVKDHPEYHVRAQKGYDLVGSQRSK